ncbi:MAG TPA: PQQ-dependent sugar dehydrogenase [Dehalococcoidia bacterium]|nr:PQQ-dependent sugar dehydrogenase [Dehalococcoidia bacterium]
MRVRTLGLAAVAVAAGVLLSGCPRANGYQAVHVYPQIAAGNIVGLQPVPGQPNIAVLVVQDGLLERVDLSDPASTPSTFLDIRGEIIANRGEEEGLLGLAFSPDYTTSGKFYVYYTRGDPRHNRLARFVSLGDHADPASEHDMLDLPPKQFSNHNGGALAFGPDGMLYIGVGDGGGGGDPNGNGQITNVLLGKVLRIDVSGDAYRIPPDNPFAQGGGAPEVWAYGLRNPWRLTFDTATGQLWTGDAGQDKWEEVDRIVRGANYGWNVMEGSHCYQPPSGCTPTGLLPRAEYSHAFGCVVIGGYVYRGRAMPEMDGWYVYGDFCSGRVWAVDASTNSGAAIPIADTGAAISSFAQGADGELYLLTFDRGVLKLTRKG